jgi:hypothetical protein
MAFDPSTVFQATAVRPIGPLEAQAKVAQLRALQNGNQLDRMKLDELRRQQQQQAAIRAAAQGAVGPQQGSYTVPGMNFDMPGATLPDGSQLPGSAAQLPDRTVNTVTPGIKTFDKQKFLQNLMQSDPLAAQGFQAQDAAAQQEQQKQQIAMQEQLAKLHSTKLDQASKELELSGRALMAIKQLPPEQQPQAYTLARQGLIQQGIAHESQLPEQFPGAQGLDGLISQGMTVSQAVQQEQERRKEAQTQKNQNLQLSARTTETDKGVMQFNPTTGAYDKRVGGLKPNASAGSGGGGDTDPNAIADGIIRGDLPPTTKGLYRNAAAVLTSLSKKGYNLQRAETDWNAVQKHIQTLNGSQQTRLNQAISTASDSLDKIDGLYSEWQKLAPTSGIKILNRASLATAKQLPGRAGAVAQALDAQIADLTSELGNVYMGGNSPTDHALGLAKQNLSSDWNDVTFREALKQARANLNIRRNSIINSGVVGATPGSIYVPQSLGGGQNGGQNQPQGNDPFASFGGKAH